MKKIIFRKLLLDCLIFFFLTLFGVSAIIWVFQAVNFLDIMIEDGRNYNVYFNYTLLNFPKIISRILPFALFFSFSYTFIKYETNNELIIFWNHGVKKISVVNFFFCISILIMFTQIILLSIVVPKSQEMARSTLRSSSVDYFEGLIKPKKFNDNIKGLTIFAEGKNSNDEFKNILGMLRFNDNGHDIFRRWYVDGRIFHHLVVDESNPKLGIREIRHIDAAKIRKVKEIKSKKDADTGTTIIENVKEHYIYQEKPGSHTGGVKMTEDSISYVTSGLLDETRKKVVSYLHKALKPINQLRMMEDSLVIYRLARAPERRIFYIDVGNLPRGKAEEYMKNIMTKYRNKLVYDASTGQLKDDRKHMSMLEDFWLPRREGGRGTEISTLPGGENLGQIDDIVYFQKRLYRSLNVPVQRLEQEQPMMGIGRSQEVNRDELKFQKFIDRLRRRFAQLFLEVLRKQLILKGIITDEDWKSWTTDIIVDFISDNNFSELRDAEMLRERLQTLDMTQQYIGEFYSKEWVWKHVLNLTDEDIKNMKKEIAQESANGEIDNEDDDNDKQPVAKKPKGVNDGNE